MSGRRKRFGWPHFHDSRQLFAEKSQLQLRDELALNLYKCMATRKEFIWDSSIKCNANTGGIFNVEYSPDGSLLLAATENKKLLVFGSDTNQLQFVVDKAHNSCVNLVKFLDLRTFVTCSDDCTLAIWDIRNLKQRIRSLEGHRNWVKSIEYDSSKGQLLSAAYDQTVLKWDINNSSRSPQKVLTVKNMLRMVLTPDSSKMIVSTADGYLMIIHDLDLNTLADDLRDFAPDLYRLMQDERNYGIDMGSWLNHLFTAKTNRVELISDFPEIDKNGYITTLDVHPYGWAVLSRNMAGNELSEWSCVHDIQHINTPHEMKPIKRIRSYFNKYLKHKTASVPSRSADTSVAHELNKNPEEESLVFKNRPRLKYYIEELNENHGFIKELCFSPDGRVVCSPHQFGFRLLSFDNKCSEMSDCLSDKPQELEELKQCLCHSDYVLTTKFSPTQCQIASGCLKGRVVFTQPIL